jgi:hypothetical protein
MLLRIILFLSLMFATPAVAHDWYPFECCSGLDCAPVEKAEVVRSSIYAGLAALPNQSAGDLIVTSRHGSAIVPSDLPRRESKDHRMHVCMRPQSSGQMRVICIFLPPPT